MYKKFFQKIAQTFIDIFILIADTWVTEFSDAKFRTSIVQDKDGGNSSNINEIRSNTTLMKNAADESSVPLSQSCTINEKLFRGMIKKIHTCYFHTSMF